VRRLPPNPRMQPTGRIAPSAPIRRRTRLAMRSKNSFAWTDCRFRLDGSYEYHADRVEPFQYEVSGSRTLRSVRKRAMSVL